MTEVAGSLIEMNAHMIMTDGAAALIAGGILAAVACLLIAFALLIDSASIHRRLYVAIFLILAGAGAAMAVIGNSRPRVKEIRACANGPVSLEQVAIKYDIVNIDGKELILRER